METTNITFQQISLCTSIVTFDEYIVFVIGNNLVQSSVRHVYKYLCCYPCTWLNTEKNAAQH